MKEIIGLIRHILTFSGGYFVASGDITEPELAEMVAALMTIVGVAWSIIEKRKDAGKVPFPPVAPLLLIPFVAVFIALGPQGCVRGPDGQVQIDPDVSDFLKATARTAALVGVGIATESVKELTPFGGQIVAGVNQVFNENDQPEDIGTGLQEVFKAVALEIGNDKLEEILLEYVGAELIPQAPGSDVGGAAQYQFNKAIVDAL